MTSLAVSWEECGEWQRAIWRSEAAPAPKRIVRVDDATRADVAFRLAAEGTALVYKGDYQNARQLLAALQRRVSASKVTGDLTRDFHLYRQARGREAQIAGKLLVPLEPDFSIPLRRAPDVRDVLVEAWEPIEKPQVAPLREVLGAIGAHEWRKNGIDVPALGGRIHPHYGVFAPIRGEYVELFARAEMGKPEVAWDIGTGTGVLALVLAKRGVPRVIATDFYDRELACARANVDRFGFADRIELVKADLWPEGRADLIVSNPPWLPGTPRAPVDHAIYDFKNQFLERFIRGLREHLAPGGEGWLVISDLAERLGIREPAFVDAQVERAGLFVRQVLRVPAKHPRARDVDDVLHRARRDEQISLYRLGLRG